MSLIIDFLAKDSDVIIYRKELNAITKKVTATILLQQMIYWHSKSNGSFYKFIEPCKNDAYSDGDSWCEELGFTKKEFMSAYQVLEDLGVVSKKINMSRVTFYTLNIEHLSKLLNGIYVSDKRELMKVTKGDLDNGKSFDRDYTENTTERKNNKKSFSFALKMAFSFEALTDEYKSKLWAYAVTKDEAVNYKAFEDYHAGKGTKFKDWSRAYNTWLNNTATFSKQSPKAPDVIEIKNSTTGSMDKAVVVGDKAVLVDSLTIVSITRRVVEPEPYQIQEPAQTQNYANQTNAMLGNLASAVKVN